MPDLKDKGFDPRAWLFTLLQITAGVFLMSLYNSNIQFQKDQTDINAGVTKLLYGLQNQIDKREAAEPYKQQQLKDMQETLKQLSRDVARLKKKHNIDE
ncbi:hypothetical protein I2I11_04250 [Pontibacter sp. 172403-2]|uniref:hypothetical protein n=1 Tax=Pontibacter rufus TaxID=2791028 RepID=UPI0018AFC227|nr:hypothetical protein [Pontibacter sp. 172403-2]MBF9252496.1 hypothetical protein [Pontibacter sp. 172403-2]